MIVDEEFKKTTSSFHMGAVQVPAISGGTQKQTLSGPANMVARRNGWLYVYASNESNQDVYFDDLIINHKRGPAVEMNNYYPFGLEIPGLHSQAIGFGENPQNKIKYNGMELQTKEFIDGSGLEEYDYGARMMDPQLGVWHSIDPHSELSRRWSPYVYALNNPIRMMDTDGMDAVGFDSYGPNSLAVSTSTVIGRDGDVIASGGGEGDEGEDKKKRKVNAVTGALLSKHAYGGDAAKEVGDVIGPEGFKVSNLKVQLDNNAPGYKAELFEATVDGTVQYVYAFAGTDDVADIIQDGLQVPGLSEQYKIAVSNAKTLSKKVGSDNITFVGHSLGGGLAQAAALATNGTAMTYNSAWLSLSTIRNNQLDMTRGNISNYFVAGEILTSFQSVTGSYLGLVHLGRDHMLINPSTFLHPLEGHKIDSVLDSW